MLIMSCVNRFFVNFESSVSVIVSGNRGKAVTSGFSKLESCQDGRDLQFVSNKLKYVTVS